MPRLTVSDIIDGSGSNRAAKFKLYCSLARDSVFSQDIRDEALRCAYILAAGEDAKRQYTL